MEVRKASQAGLAFRPIVFLGFCPKPQKPTTQAASTFGSICRYLCVTQKSLTENETKDRDRDTRYDRKEPPKPKRDAEPELYGIYDGKVSNILDFGCFVELDKFFRKEGLVHIAQIQQGMVRDAKQVVKRGQQVKVKVISMVGSKMALSMKEVDQTTGADLLPSRSKDALAKLSSDLTNPMRPQDSLSNPINAGVDMRLLREKEMEEETGGRHNKKRIASPEMWEVQQLIHSGVLPVTEYPTFDAESGNGLVQSVEVEEEVEVELNEDEPAFLRGQTRMSRDFSPVRIVKVNFHHCYHTYNLHFSFIR